MSQSSEHSLIGWNRAASMPALKERPTDKVSFGSAAPVAVSVSTLPPIEQVPLKPMLGQLLTHWMMTTNPSAPAFIPITVTGTSSDFAERLQTYVKGEQANFQKLPPHEASTLIKRIDRNSVRGAIVELDRLGVITMTDTRQDYQNHLTLTLNQAHRQPPQRSVEQILMSNLSGIHQVTYDLTHRILSGEFPPGTVMPAEIEVEGHSISHALRTQALGQIMRNTGRLELVRFDHRDRASGSVPMNGHTGAQGEPTTLDGRSQVLSASYFMVLPPQASPPVHEPSISWGPTQAIVMFYLLDNPEHYRPNFIVLPDEGFMAMTGLTQHPFGKAKRALADRGLGSNRLLHPKPKGFALARTLPSDEQVLSMISGWTNNGHHYAHSFLGNMSNDQRAKTWTANGDLIPFITFEKGIVEKTKKSEVSKLVHALNGAPVPLMFADARRFHSLNARLNPVMDYDQLKATMAPMLKHPKTMAAGAVLNMGVWQMPKLYESMMKVRPAFWLSPTEHTDQYKLEMGLMDTEGSRGFTPLSQVPPPLPNAVPAGAEPDQSQPPKPGDPLNKRLYGERLLDLVHDRFPLEAFNRLKQQPSVTISATAAENLKRLKAPLETVGYFMAV